MPSPCDVLGNQQLAGTPARRARRPTPASRRPLLQWPHEIPIDSEPQDVAEIVTAYGAWMARSPTPRLPITFDAVSVLGSSEIVERDRQRVASLDIVKLGPAGHHAPEDQSDAIGAAIAKWLSDRKL